MVRINGHTPSFYRIVARLIQIPEGGRNFCAPHVYLRGENGVERETRPKARPRQRLCFAGPREQPTTYH